MNDMNYDYEIQEDCLMVKIVMALSFQRLTRLINKNSMIQPPKQTLCIEPDLTSPHQTSPQCIQLNINLNFS